MKTLLVTGLVLACAPSVWAQTTYTDYGDPSAALQNVLELINRARRDPFTEGTRLGIDIREGLSVADAAALGQRPPLALNAKLSAAAAAHSQDMWNRNFFAHNAPAPGASTPDQRMTTAGYVFTPAHSWGENIAAATSWSPATLEDFLMVDAGIGGRGHRVNLLDASSSSFIFREIGLGYTSHAPNGSNLGTHLTQDFARNDGNPPFILGAVYTDANSNNFFDLGETGIANVTITPNTGSFKGVTATAGGYAFPTLVGAGTTVTLTPSGGGIAWPVPGPGVTAIVKKVILSGENHKVDFKSADAIDADGDGMPDWWEDLHGFNKNSNTDAGLDADSDGTTNLEEFQYDSNPHNSSSTKNNPYPLGSPPPPGGGSPGGGGGGGCGLTGLEAVLALLLLRRRRSAK